MGSQGNEKGAIGSSLAMFGAVALMMTEWQRQASSSEDLGGSFFDSDHEEEERFVQSIPKVELHVHLDGAFDPYQLWSHLSKHPELIQCFPVEKELPWSKPDEPPVPLQKMVNECDSPLDYRRLCTCRRRYRQFRTRGDRRLSSRKKEKQGTLEDMLTCFEFFFPLVYDNLTLLEELAHDFVKRQYEQNVIYTEVRYSPHLLAKDPKQSLEAITRGLRRGCEEYNVIVNQIMCGINFSPQWSKEVVELADRHRDDFPCAVVGIDVAAGEDHFSVDSPLHQGHYDMCQRAKELNLNITIHAGETPGSAKNVRKAIDHYGAKRIGHAYRIASHEEILNHVRDNGVHIEICPTSSVETGGWQKTTWPEHPANEYWDRGISLSFSSDDPAVFNTSLTWQYRIAMKKMGWEEGQMKEMVNKAIQAAFIDDEKKQELQKKVDEWLVHDNLAFDDRVHYDD